ncbi:hypothetical protein COO60DRAFT_530782 [Scenedesmus sp. NREL 46B-D3]|nr:hypothetical protein COO60DRAFT_530782 [Scenedesmus sp. NREL 46B-D3]
MCIMQHVRILLQVFLQAQFGGGSACLVFGRTMDVIVCNRNPFCQVEVRRGSLSNPCSKDSAASALPGSGAAALAPVCKWSGKNQSCRCNAAYTYK